MGENFWEEIRDASYGYGLSDLLHETVLAIDNELMRTKDLEYREKLVQMAYQLRVLIHKHIQNSADTDIRLPDFNLMKN